MTFDISAQTNLCNDCQFPSLLVKRLYSINKQKAARQFDLRLNYRTGSGSDLAGSQHSTSRLFSGRFESCEPDRSLPLPVL